MLHTLCGHRAPLSPVSEELYISFFVFSLFTDLKGVTEFRGDLVALGFIIHEVPETPTQGFQHLSANPYASEGGLRGLDGT